MPAISKEYPIDRNRQAIVGHSMGGLLTLHALFTRPYLFTHYVSGSPSIWWGNNEVLKEQERFAATWQGEYRRNLLLTIGANELSNMLDEVEQMAERIQPLSKKAYKQNRSNLLAKTL